MGEVKSIKYSLLALVQGDLEIPVEVNMHWEEKWALEILKTKTKEVSYPLRGDRWQLQDESKEILNSIFKEEVLSDSDPEESIEESWTNEVL